MLEAYLEMCCAYSSQEKLVRPQSDSASQLVASS